LFNNLLSAAMRAGQIDIVVVYKIDRLTRSLFDFAELIKVFEEYRTTFVSVTQQINTTDAMGRMTGPDGRALSPWHTTKANGRVYRYYLSTRDIQEGRGTSGLPRVPAAELEMAVVGQLRQLLRAPEMIEAIVPQALALDPTLDEAQVTVAMTQVDRVWEQLFPAEQQRLVRLLVERVIVTPTNLELRLRPGGIGSLAADARQVAEAVA